MRKFWHYNYTLYILNVIYRIRNQSDNRDWRMFRQIIHIPEVDDDDHREKQILSNNKRVMTDVVCLWIYCILSVVVISAFFYAYILETQKNIFKPKDPDGRTCGGEGAIGYPFIYFPVPFTSSIQKSVCVKECPTNADFQLNCLYNSLVGSCKMNITDHFNRLNQFIVYETSPNRFLSMCQPSSFIIFNALNERINTYSLFNNFQMIYESAQIIFIACPVISLFLVVVYVCLLTQIKNIKPLLIFFIVSFIIILVSFSVYSFTTSAKNIFAYIPFIGIGVFVIAVIFIVTIVYNRNFLFNSLNILNLGAVYIRQNRSLIFTSLVLFLLWIIVFLLQLIAFMFIYSMDTGGHEGQKQIFAYFIGIQNSLIVQILLALTVVHYLWTNAILYSAGQYICMGAASYWIMNIQHNFKNSLFTLLRFHIGSVILGSIMSHSIGLITQFLYGIMPSPNSKLLCFSCQKFYSFYQSQCFSHYFGAYYELNYIRVAIFGEDLRTAGIKITNHLVGHLNKVSKAYRLARLIAFISKVLVALTTTFICYVIIEVNPNMRGYFLTNIIIFVFSYFLISFAFESYDRSFQVLLITIIMNKYTENSLSPRKRPNQNSDKKDSLYIYIEEWFMEEVKKQKQNETK